MHDAEEDYDAEEDLERRTIDAIVFRFGYQVLGKSPPFGHSGETRSFYGNASPTGYSEAGGAPA